jgi:transcriptional regulator with XRE-family HTH domain
MDISELLKKIRLDRGYTLSTVASSINVSSGFISQIENGVSSPSIQSLMDILKFYNVPLSDFFRQMEKEDTVLVRAEDVETITGKKGLAVSYLASKLEHNVLESYKIDLTDDEPLKGKGSNKDINGERFVFVLKGSIEITLQKKQYFLQPGDSINFKSHIPFTIIRIGSKAASFLINGTPPVL